MISCSHFFQILINDFPYLGKNNTRPKTERLADNVVLNLSALYMIRGKNIITDNYFTSLNLAQTQKKKNITLVGTINPVRKEIPK